MLFQKTNAVKMIKFYNKSLLIERTLFENWKADQLLYKMNLK